MRNGLPLLRDRAGRPDPQPVDGGIVEQVVAAQRRLARDVPDGRLSNVVFMGMGEPLANYRAVVAAVRRLTDPHPHGFGLSQRSITVSTVGLVPRIDDLAGEGLAVTLALSLHAPDDELRDTLVPVNQRWPVSEAVGAALRYARRTGRRMTVEYALINDINDDPAAGGRARRPFARHACSRQSDPAEPHPGQHLDGQHVGSRARVRPAVACGGRRDDRARHPGARGRRRVRAIGRHRLMGRAAIGAIALAAVVSLTAAGCSSSPKQVATQPTSTSAVAGSSSPAPSPTPSPQVTHLPAPTRTPGPAHPTLYIDPAGPEAGRPRLPAGRWAADHRRPAGHPGSAGALPGPRRHRLPRRQPERPAGARLLRPRPGRREPRLHRRHSQRHQWAVELLGHRAAAG